MQTLKFPESPSYIELSKSAYLKNLKLIKNLLGDNTEFSSVVKGNAYGHGVEQFLPLAESLGVKSFSVYDDYEAYNVWSSLKNKSAQLIVMGNVTLDSIEWLIENKIEFYVFDMKRLMLAEKSAKKFNSKARIHIEVETGLNRTGFDRNDLNKLTHFLIKHKNRFEIKGLCTHYGGAESLSNYIRIQNQIKEFNSIHSLFKEQNIRVEKRHTACSAAALSYPETRMDLARIGIMQYGFWPSKETAVFNYLSNGGNALPLKRIISWKSKVMVTKKVKSGEYVSYGTSYLAEKAIKVAVIPVGYAHGYYRAFSNLGRVLIKGKRLSVIGLVNMNCIIVDITNCPDVEQGDEVVLIGKQGKLEITVSSFSELSHQMNYELLTRLPLDIPRRIVK